MIIFSANLDKPLVADISAAEETSGEKLVAWANGAAKPRLHTVTSANQLDSLCLRRTWCAMVLTARGRGLLPPGEKKALNEVAGAARRVRFVTVDMSKYTLQVPGGEELGDLTPSVDHATVVLVKAAADKASGAPSARLIDTGLILPGNTSSAVLAALEDSAEVTLTDFPLLLTTYSLTDVVHTLPSGRPSSRASRLLGSLPNLAGAGGLHCA